MAKKGNTPRKLDIHALADLIPFSRTALLRLTASMQELGFDPHFPIMLYEGKILDGRTRYEAALAADVTPVSRPSGEPSLRRGPLLSLPTVTAGICQTHRWSPFRSITET